MHAAGGEQSASPFLVGAGGFLFSLILNLTQSYIDTRTNPTFVSNLNARPGPGCSWKQKATGKTTAFQLLFRLLLLSIEQAPQSRAVTAPGCRSLRSVWTMFSDVGFEFWVVLRGARGWTRRSLWIPSHSGYCVLLDCRLWAGFLCPLLAAGGSLWAVHPGGPAWERSFVAPGGRQERREIRRGEKKEDCVC